MIRRKDLVGIGDKDYKYQREYEFMLCQDCGAEFGGTRGDYFMLAMDYIFDCPDCGGNDIALVRRVNKIVIVKQ